MSDTPRAPITRAEVRGWFRKRAQLTDEQCDRIADCLTNKVKWDGDPRRELRIIDDDGRSWDMKGSVDAAKLLEKSLPTLRAFYEGVAKSDPRAQEAVDRLISLDRALREALPHIERPFGEYEPRQGRYHKSKAWHSAALVVAGVILRETDMKSPPLSFGSTLPRVVHQAIKRMGYAKAPRAKGAVTVSETAISAFLMRWRKANPGGFLSD